MKREKKWRLREEGLGCVFCFFPFVRVRLRVKLVMSVTIVKSVSLYVHVTVSLC